MKKIKKLIVAILAMAMVIGCFAVQASAGDGVDNGAYYVIGTMNDWSTSSPSAMTKNGTVYTYQYNLDAAGEVAFKICEKPGVDWSNIGYTFKYDGAPNDGNFAKTAGQAGTVVITFDTSKLDVGKWWDAAPAVTITGTAFEVAPEKAYYVAGVEALCGTNYKENDPNNKMTDNGDGTWSKTYTSVANGNYAFKVTDGTWSNSWGDNGNNYEFAVSTACDVTITFNESSKAITVTGTGIGVPTLEVEKIIIAGTANICGEAYKENLAANQMTANGKIYTKTYTGLAADTYKVKFCANGSWDANWGGTFDASGVATDADYNGADISFTTTFTQSSVTIKLDLTNYDHATKEGAKFTITITDTTPAGGDSGSGSTGSGDAGSEDAGSEDAGSEEAGSEEAGSEDAGSGDAGSGDAGNGSTGSGNEGSGASDKLPSTITTVTQKEIDAIKASVKVEGSTEKLVISPLDPKSKDVEVISAALKKELNTKFVVADLKFESGKQPAAGTKITLDVTKMDVVKDAKYVVVYAVKDSKLEKVDTVEVKDGKITFEPKHFSTYVFVSASSTTTGVNTAVVVASVSLLLAAAVAVIASKKRVEE